MFLREEGEMKSNRKEKGSVASLVSSLVRDVRCWRRDEVISMHELGAGSEESGGGSWPDEHTAVRALDDPEKHAHTCTQTQTDRQAGRQADRHSLFLSLYLSISLSLSVSFWP